jgi:hypothetical protein
MTSKGSQKTIITLDTESGKVISIVDEYGKEASRVSPEEVDKIYGDEKGFRYVSTVLHAHSSPGCIYIRLGGTTYKICY